MYLRYKQKLIIGVTLLIVAVLIISSTFVYFEYYAEKSADDDERETGEPLYDYEAISPYVNQAVIIEIERIRHRGIIDAMMSSGRSWKSPPQFYFITNMDDQEYISKDVAAAGGASNEELFNTWDSMFIENKIVRDAEEEQEKSTINLKIMERKTSGLLGRRHTDQEELSIDLTYDYKTGRWEGDDHMNDSDGYGHVLGDTFEVWFNVYQTDYDGDGIPYWTEVNVLGTDPKIDDTHNDHDGDGCPTVWEWKWGYNHTSYDNHSTLDPDQDGLENVEEYIMQKYFANPYHQEIYIEVDGMEKGKLLDWDHVFWMESQQIMIERFAEHSISIFINDGWPGGPTNGGGELLPYYDTISQDSGMMLQFYEHHFADEHKGIYRYIVIGNNAGFCHPAKYNRYDSMAVGTSINKLVTKRGAFTPRTQRLALAAGVMHELGHSLGIGPWNLGGNDNISFITSRDAKAEYLEEWGNYKSVMNYYYIWDKTIVDYSDGSNGLGDVSDWEMFNLTYFQNDAKVVEDPGFELPGFEEIGFVKYMYYNGRFDS